jgi:maltose O-acetyltransferase
MASEKEKMLDGELYDPRDGELVAARMRARELLCRLNDVPSQSPGLRTKLLEDLLGSFGDELWIETPFFCDYGSNIHLGERVYFNFNCVILDAAEVRIGSRTLLGPGVQIYAATHPLLAEERRQGLELARPVTIGSDVWLGGNAVVLPGVSIGDRSTIGAASVVTSDVPEDVVAAGNPCRILRHLR